MNGFLTVLVRTAPGDVEPTLIALRAADIEARTDIFDDTGLELVSAGFPHDGPRPTPDQRAAAAELVVGALRAADVAAEVCGGGFSTAAGWSAAD